MLLAGIILLMGVGLYLALSTHSSPTSRKTSKKTTAPSASTDKKLVRQAKKIAKASFLTLSKQLKKAFQKGGPPHAISFCSTKALPITAELSKKFKVTISRKSHRYRNPKNRANQEETKIIQDYIKALKAKKALKPVVKKRGKQGTDVYLPIRIISPLCLVCHGRPGKELSKPVVDTLKKHYPKDLAKNFQMGEFRGLWKIQFSAKQVAANTVVKPFIKDISTEKAHGMLKKNPDWIVLDIRTSSEYTRGHIKGAKNINYRSWSFKSQLAKLDKSKTYIVHCASGNRSGRSMPIFKALKFKKIYHMNKGYRGWKADGFATVR